MIRWWRTMVSDWRARKVVTGWCRVLAERIRCGGLDMQCMLLLFSSGYRHDMLTAIFSDRGREVEISEYGYACWVTLDRIRVNDHATRIVRWALEARCEVLYQARKRSEAEELRAGQRKLAATLS